MTHFFACHTLQVVEHLGCKLAPEAVQQAKTDAYIVDRLKGALHQLKQCRSLEEWQDYLVVLAAVAPERLSTADASRVRDECRSITKVAARLGVTPGTFWVKATANRPREKRPRAFDKAITCREAFDEAVQMGSGKFKVGDKATSRGCDCTIVEIDEDADTCKLSFSAEGVERECSFSCIYKPKGAPGKAPFPIGSARLRRAPPSLRPGSRTVRSDEKAEKARAKVHELFNAEGAHSPSQRDQVRRRVGPGLYEKAQALMVYSTYKALYAIYKCTYYASYPISFATFKRLRPWNIRRVKQEGCLCKMCTNFKGYMKQLHSIGKLFESLVDPQSIDADDTIDDDNDATEASSWEGKELLSRLLEFCAIDSKSGMVQFCLCKGALDGAGKLDCIHGRCKDPKCGFDQIWSKGLRPFVVDAYGNIKSSAPVEFQSHCSWIRIRSSKKTEPGEAKQPTYESNSGTVVQFLDQFERDVMRKFPHHRHTIARQKAMAAEFERNRGPGWLQVDADFAMDGDIPPPGGESIQSDHWCPMTYTEFNLVGSWLESLAWISRDSKLAVYDAVTVEPADKSVSGAILPAEDSKWAEVVKLPPCSTVEECAVPPERKLYGVRQFGAAEDDVMYVERQFLRHRKLHTKAFVHISDDKVHDSQELA